MQHDERVDIMLYEKLSEYSKSGIYPMHMPGHKRNAEQLPSGLPFDIDITEIYGFDDLREPRGILMETAGLAAAMYDSTKAFLLVNGSTVGILSAIGAHVKHADKILIAGNCHRSVTNAARLFGLNSIYLTPETDKTSGVSCSIDPAAVRSVLENDAEIKLVVVTSPSYEGIVSDVKSIAGAAHEHDIPLIVDEAHGAHLGFSGYFPENATRLGADVVIMSLHKTLPALTQCSLLHICGKYADADKTACLLSILQTSSPSYVLMASIDHCLRLITSDKSKLFSEYEQNLKRFSEYIMALKRLTVLNCGNDGPHQAFFAYDPGKLVIVTKNTALSGVILADILR